MHEAADASELRTSSATGREYTEAAHVRHRSKTTLRRLVFFTLASTWGFVVGVAGLLAAIGATGEAVHPGPSAVLGLIPAGVVAIAGGFVAAAAYKESQRHGR